MKIAFILAIVTAAMMLQLSIASMAEYDKLKEKTLQPSKISLTTNERDIKESSNGRELGTFDNKLTSPAQSTKSKILLKKTEDFDNNVLDRNTFDDIEEEYVSLNENIYSNVTRIVDNSIRVQAKKVQLIPTRIDIYCSAHDDLYVYQNTKLIGRVSSWKTLFRKSLLIRQGDVILLRAIRRGKNDYGVICSILVRENKRIGKKGPGRGDNSKQLYSQRYYSTGVSSKWRVSKGQKFGQGNDRLKYLVTACKNRNRWRSPSPVRMRTGKSRTFPYSKTGAKYVWGRGSVGTGVLYLRYIHGTVKC